MDVRFLLDRLKDVKGHEPNWTALCPAHDDRNNRSLSITNGSDKILLKCFVGCQAVDVVKHLGLEWSALFDGSNNTSSNANNTANRYELRQRVWSIRNLANVEVARHKRFDWSDGTKTYSWERGSAKTLDGYPVRRLPLYGTEHLAALAPRTLVILCEGEKAADAIQRLGIASVGTVTGAATTPEAEPLSALQPFDVILWPDNDQIGREHMLKIGTSLQSHEVTPRVLQWAAAPKAGDAADFVEAGGNLETLKALIATAIPFNQFGWEVPATGLEKQTVIERTDSGVIVTWPGDPVEYQAGITRIEARKDELNGFIELRQRIGETPWRILFARTRHNFYSKSGKGDLNRVLDKRTKGDWSDRIEQLTGIVEQALLEVDPPVVLADMPDPGGDEWLMSPLLEAHEHTVVFAEGGSGKSIFALAIGVSVATKIPMVAGMFPATQVSVLYLDWETRWQTHRTRMARLAAGRALTMPSNFFYQRMAGTFMDVVESVKLFVRTKGIGLVIIDSIGMACGGNLNDDFTAISYNNAVRVLELAGATVLSLAHVPKDRLNQLNPIGSIYFTNAPRAVWKMVGTRQPGENTTDIVISNPKANNAALAKEIGLRLEWTENAVRFYRQDPRAVPELAVHMNNVDRIAYELRNGMRTAEQVADETGIKAPVVKATLYRWKDRRFVQRGNEWGNLKPVD